MRTIYLETRDPYIIGKTGESQKTALRVNVEEWYQDYPSGAGVLLFVRPNKVTYPLETNLVQHEGKHYLETIVTTNETKLPGWVVITAQWYDGETLLHGRTYSGKVLTSNGTNVTDGVQETTPTWVAELIDGIQAINETAATVQEAYDNMQHAVEMIDTAIQTAQNTVEQAQEYAGAAEVYKNTANTYKNAAAESATAAATSAEQAMDATPDGYATFVGSMADAYSAASGYAVGDYVLKDGQLYRCTVAVDDEGETWTAAHWVAVNVGRELGSINNAVGTTELNEWTANKAYNTGSKVEYIEPYNPGTSTNYYKCACLPCKQGDVFYVTATGSNGARPYVFLSSASTENIIEKASENALSNHRIVAPANAAYVIFNVAVSKDYCIVIGELIKNIVGGISSEVNPVRIPVELGGYNSDGTLHTYANRFRSTVAIPVEPEHQYEMTVSDEYMILPLFYTSNEITSYNSRATGFRYGRNVFIVPAGCTHIRVYGRNKAGTDITSFPNDLVIKKIDFEVKTIQRNREDNTFTQENFSWGENRYGSGMTVCHNLLFRFGTTPDDNLTYGYGLIYYIDNENKSVQIMEQFTHNFGHVNSVDYCEETDCLIFGNGSGDMELAGKFYVYENFFKAMKENSRRQLNLSDAICFDCSSENLGSQMNLIWGDGNCGKNNLAIMATDRFTKIRRVLLGKGETQYTHGTYIGSDRAFNGTFEILTENVMTDTLYSDVLQDMDYRDHTIYCGVGHGTRSIWKLKLNTDGTIDRETIVYDDYNNDGTAYEGGIGGITVEPDYIIADVGRQRIAMFNR